MDYRPIIRGIGTLFVNPAGNLGRWLSPPAPQGSGRSASYCYGVWLKHLSLLWEQGRTSLTGDVAEFGPGESLGSGIAALLSGARSYTAFDAATFAAVDCNLALLDELVDLFRKRAARPRRGWPDFDHLLDETGFPSQILDGVLPQTLRPNRIESIRTAIAQLRERPADGLVRYFAPWRETSEVRPGSFDIIFSQSVLEYIDDLDDFHRTCWSWLKPGGWTSHQIDLSSLGMTRQWNGHWSYSPAIWRLVKGRRPFFMTRKTRSDHLASIERAGFTIQRALSYLEPGIARAQLCRANSGMSAEDFACSGVFVIARKP